LGFFEPIVATIQTSHKPKNRLEKQRTSLKITNFIKPKVTTQEIQRKIPSNEFQRNWLWLGKVFSVVII